MPYGGYGGYGGGYNPLLLEESKQNPFYNPYSASPDYWGGTASILTNLWKAKQLQEQQVYERAMEERKMALQERQAGGKAAQTPDELMKVQMLVAGGVSLPEAFRMVGGYKNEQPKKTQLEQEAAMLVEAGYDPKEAKRLAVLGREPKQTPPKPPTEEDAALLKQVGPVLKTALTSIEAQLKPGRRSLTTFRDTEVSEGKPTQLGANAIMIEQSGLHKKRAGVQAAIQEHARLLAKVTAGQPLTEEERAKVIGWTADPYSSGQPSAAGAEAPSIFQAPQPPAPKIGGPPPQAGMFSGQVATNKKTGQKFIWNGESWQPIK